jgi:fructokinase
MTHPAASGRSGPFVVVGEALVDVVVTGDGEVRQAPGGSPLNVAVGLSRLGVDTLLVTRYGDDAPGLLVAEHLSSSAVAVDESSLVPGSRTSTATAHLDVAGAATYTFDLGWELEDARLPPDAVAVHTGSLGAALRPGRDAVLRLLDEAAAAGLPVSFDPNARPSLTPDAEAAARDVLECSRHAHVVKLSDEDLAFLWPGRDAADLAAQLLAGPTELVVVTTGGEGATAYSRTASIHVAGRRVDVVDTVGAGDSFMSALLAVVLEHGLADLDEARLAAYVEAANEAAAITVSRRGADPPRRDELPDGWPRIPH